MVLDLISINCMMSNIYIHIYTLYHSKVYVLCTEQDVTFLDIFFSSSPYGLFSLFHETIIKRVPKVSWVISHYRTATEGSTVNTKIIWAMVNDSAVQTFGIIKDTSSCTRHLSDP